MNGKPILCRGRPIPPKRGKRHSGKHLTSWFAHSMRCSCGCVLTCMASWDSIAFLAGRSDACGMYMSISMLLQVLCISGFTCFLAELSDIIECNCKIAICQIENYY